MRRTATSEERLIHQPILITPSQRDRLRLVANERGVSLCEEVRRAIAGHLQTVERELAEQR